LISAATLAEDHAEHQFASWKDLRFQLFASLSPESLLLGQQGGRESVQHYAVTPGMKGRRLLS
jgi:hypothetical protein